MLNQQLGLGCACIRVHVKCWVIERSMNMELSLLHMKGLFAVAKEGEWMHEQTL